MASAIGSPRNKKRPSQTPDDPSGGGDDKEHFGRLRSISVKNLLGLFTSNETEGGTPPKSARGRSSTKPDWRFHTMSRGRSDSRWLRKQRKADAIIPTFDERGEAGGDDTSGIAPRAGRKAKASKREQKKQDLGKGNPKAEKPQQNDAKAESKQTPTKKKKQKKKKRQSTREIAAAIAETEREIMELEMKVEKLSSSRSLSELVESGPSSDPKREKKQVKPERSSIEVKGASDEKCVEPKGHETQKETFVGKDGEPQDALLRIEGEKDEEKGEKKEENEEEKGEKKDEEKKEEGDQQEHIQDNDDKTHGKEDDEKEKEKETPTPKASSGKLNYVQDEKDFRSGASLSAAERRARLMGAKGGGFGQFRGKNPKISVTAQAPKKSSSSESSEDSQEGEKHSHLEPLSIPKSASQPVTTAKLLLNDEEKDTNSKKSIVSGSDRGRRKSNAESRNRKFGKKSIISYRFSRKKEKKNLPARALDSTTLLDSTGKYHRAKFKDEEDILKFIRVKSGEDSGSAPRQQRSSTMPHAGSDVPLDVQNIVRQSEMATKYDLETFETSVEVVGGFLIGLLPVKREWKSEDEWRGSDESSSNCGDDEDEGEVAPREGVHVSQEASVGGEARTNSAKLAKPQKELERTSSLWIRGWTEEELLESEWADGEDPGEMSKESCDGDDGVDDVPGKEQTENDDATHGSSDGGKGDTSEGKETPPKDDPHLNDELVKGDVSGEIDEMFHGAMEALVDEVLEEKQMEGTSDKPSSGGDSKVDKEKESPPDDQEENLFDGALQALSDVNLGEEPFSTGASHIFKRALKEYDDESAADDSKVEEKNGDDTTTDAHDEIEDTIDHGDHQPKPSKVDSPGTRRRAMTTVGQPIRKKDVHLFSPRKLDQSPFGKLERHFRGTDGEFRRSERDKPTLPVKPKYATMRRHGSPLGKEHAPTLPSKPRRRTTSSREEAGASVNIIEGLSVPPKPSASSISSLSWRARSRQKRPSARDVVAAMSPQDAPLIPSRTPTRTACSRKRSPSSHSGDAEAVAEEKHTTGDDIEETKMEDKVVVEEPVHKKDVEESLPVLPPKPFVKLRQGRRLSLKLASNPFLKNDLKLLGEDEIVEQVNQANAH